MARPKGSKSNPLRRQLPFKQSEVERAIRGAQARGIAVGRIEVETRGGTKIAIIPAGPTVADSDASDESQWNEAVKKNAKDQKRPS